MTCLSETYCINQFDDLLERLANRIIENDPSTSANGYLKLSQMYNSLLKLTAPHIKIS